MKNITFNRISFFRAFPILGVLCFILFGAANLFAQTAMVTNNFVYYPTDDNPSLVDNWQCILSTETVNALTSTNLGNRSFVYSSNTAYISSNTPTNGYNTQSPDPWVNSGLIEYDQAFVRAGDTKAKYPNHCLSLCAEVTCMNPVRKMESTNSSGTATVANSIASTDFPIQQILFDIFKYQVGSNPYNADTTPPIRTIAMYAYEGSGIDNICNGVPTCCDAPANAVLSTDVTNPSCNDYPEYTKSCCEACTWNATPSCGTRSGTGHVCEDNYGSNQSACEDLQTAGFCTWNDSATCTNLDSNPCHSVQIDQCGTGASANYCKKVGTSAGTCEWNGVTPQCNGPDQESCEEVVGCYWTGSCGIEEHYNDCAYTGQYAQSQCTQDPFCEWTPSSYTCEWKDNSVCATNFSGTQASCPNQFCSYVPGGSCTTNATFPCTNYDESECNGYSQFCEWFQSTIECNSEYANGSNNQPLSWWQNVWSQISSWFSGSSDANAYGISTENTCARYPVTSEKHPCHDIITKFNTKEECKAGLTTLHFCTPWDGTYEIDGEFGKTNGQYGFRTTIKSNVPSDGISTTGNINIEHMIAFPGDTQIPMQIDVTNVHSVRSSPTLVGQYPSVATAPYKLRYRLSKDATTTIEIIDPEVNPASIPPTGAYIHRHLVNAQPRDGEKFQGGAQTDTVRINEENWDGRDDEGRLLPYGNYMVTIQASSRDEWSGPTDRDLSRAVTRQLSLDPLKITDITVTGLSKESTAYAKIDYMLTEAATVHLEIYTPGTVFNGSLNITPVAPGGTPSGIYPSNGPAVPDVNILDGSSGMPTGYRVASYTEQKARRVSVNSKWDGMCWDTVNCQVSTNTLPGTTDIGYAYGGALPDGDYVYLLWAEIPYGSSSGSGAPDGTLPPSDNLVTVNNVEWDGVKTYMIYNGILPINRGFPEITIDSVSYSTIGSSPIANGLDPFVISYSLSRDSYVDAGIYTMASSGTYTSGVCESSGTSSECAPYKVKTISENEVKEALTKNTYSWDGLDDQGRYVSAGNYMLRITAKDSLFPAKMVTRTIQFPVDMFRVVDVQTTPLLELGSSNTLSGLASISYMLSKSMEVTVKIYDRGVIIPKQNCAGGWPPVEQNGSMTDFSCIIHDSADPFARITPIKEFRGTRQGEGYTITDYWDGYKVDANQTATEMMPDGLYPYIIIASASVPGAQYYSTDTADGIVYPLYGPWHPLNGMYASDEVTGYITVSRGPVYFTNINIRATHPTQYYSSATVELAPYEIQFSVNRVSSITVQVISTVPGACMGPTSPVGTICRTLTKTNFIGSNLQDFNVYDAGILNTLYWDGKDEKGDYVRTANYQIKFTAVPYLSDGITDTGLNVTVENRNLVVNNFQVFDRYIWDVATQNKNQGKFAYQISVPMKTAIQIFKPGTRVVNIDTGELDNPIQGAPTVQPIDTRDVLVKSIVGVRPNLVSLEEIWDGTDYAGQQVPDGIYPFRFVTVLDSYQMNSITGDPIVENFIPGSTMTAEVVMDWDKYINFSIINVVNGDSWYADIDWKDPKVTMFYPNPMKNDVGFFEVTKVPAPGTLSIKIYNIAGDLVRDGGYDCVNAIGTTAKLEDINGVYGGLTPDWNKYGYSNPAATGVDPTLLGSNALGRNSALRCKWDRKNNAGKKVARGLYYAIMTLKPTRGNSKNSQRVIKILIP